jgi:hypothetical protein
MRWTTTCDKLYQHNLLTYNVIGTGVLMAYHGFSQPDHALFAARRRLSDKQHPSNLDVSADGFIIWWNKTFARHIDVIAQASALVRAHQDSNTSADTRGGQSHLPNLW